MVTAFRAILLSSFLFTGLLSAQIAPQSPDSQSCQRFAQHFYDWYVPFTEKQLSMPASDVALQHKPTAFTPELLRALKLDSEAQARAKEIVGLDFDPFLGSQDPADRYEARDAVVKRGICSVGIWRASPIDRAAKMDKPEAVAELTQGNGGWRFANFTYAFGGPDLLHLLENLRTERRNQEGSAPR